MHGCDAHREAPLLDSVDQKTTFSRGNYPPRARIHGRYDRMHRVPLPRMVLNVQFTHRLICVSKERKAPHGLPETNDMTGVEHAVLVPWKRGRECTRSIYHGKLHVREVCRHRTTRRDGRWRRRKGELNAIRDEALQLRPCQRIADDEHLRRGVWLPRWLEDMSR